MSFRPKNTQDRILHRLHIARGHLEKVTHMVEEQVYCIDIIHQSQAVQEALRKTDHVVLEHHLKTCVSRSIRHGKSKAAVEEIMNVVKHTHI